MPRLLNRILRRPDRGVTPEQNLLASPQLASPSRTGNEGYAAPKLKIFLPTQLLESFGD